MFGECSTPEHLKAPRTIPCDTRMVLNSDKDFFLKRTVSVDTYGWLLGFHERYVRSVLDMLGMGQTQAVVTPGSKEASTAATAAGEKQWDTYSH